MCAAHARRCHAGASVRHTGGVTLSSGCVLRSTTLQSAKPSKSAMLPSQSKLRARVSPSLQLLGDGLLAGRLHVEIDALVVAQHIIVAVYSRASRARRRLGAMRRRTQPPCKR